MLHDEEAVVQVMEKHISLTLAYLTVCVSWWAYQQVFLKWVSLGPR